MKTKKVLKKFRSAFIVLALFLALVSATAIQGAAFNGQESIPSVALAQDTPTPPAEDYSTIGSTDGIVAMGFAIVAIIVIPIVIKRKSWSNN